MYRVLLGFTFLRFFGFFLDWKVCYHDFTEIWPSFFVLVWFSRLCNRFFVLNWNWLFKVGTRLIVGGLGFMKISSRFVPSFTGFHRPNHQTNKNGVEKVVGGDRGATGGHGNAAKTRRLQLFQSTLANSWRRRPLFRFLLFLSFFFLFRFCRRRHSRRHDTLIVRSETLFFYFFFKVDESGRA